MKYAAIYSDGGLICTDFHDTEEQAWQQLINQTDETKYELESAYHIQGMTDKQIKDLPDIDN